MIAEDRGSRGREACDGCAEPAGLAARGAGAAVGGCALTAVRPPTPAARLDSATLDHAAPGERFYVLIFASQTLPRRPAFSHTWATVVRAVDRPGLCPAIEAHTISWLPA